MRDRTFHGTDHVGNGYLVRGASEPVTTAGATAGSYYAAVLHLQQDVFQKLEWDVLGVGKPLTLDRTLWGGREFGCSADGIVGFCGYAHGPI